MEGVQTELRVFWSGCKKRRGHYYEELISLHLDNEQEGIQANYIYPHIQDIGSLSC